MIGYFSSLITQGNQYSYACTSRNNLVVSIILTWDREGFCRKRISFMRKEVLLEADLVSGILLISIFFY